LPHFHCDDLPASGEIVWFKRKFQCLQIEGIWNGKIIGLETGALSSEWVGWKGVGR